jgi:hypothetical protein
MDETMQEWQNQHHRLANIEHLVQNFDQAGRNFVSRCENAFCQVGFIRDRLAHEFDRTDCLLSLKREIYHAKAQLLADLNMYEQVYGVTDNATDRQT